MTKQSGPFGTGVKATLGVAAGLAILAIGSSAAAIAADAVSRALDRRAERKRNKAEEAEVVEEAS